VDLGLVPQTQSRKFTYCSGCSMFISFMNAMVSCKSSRFLPDIRSSVPWIETWTLILAPLTALVILRPRSTSIPCLMDMDCLMVPPAAFCAALNSNAPWPPFDVQDTREASPLPGLTS